MVSLTVEKAASSAPGKVILFGEHFVVYDKPAIVSAINLRARVEAWRYEKPGVWIGYRMLVDHPSTRAVEYVLEKTGFMSGIKLKILSKIPASVGLGSSASVSVASAASASLISLGRIERELVEKAALEGEKIVHVNPSGIDTTIALRGGSGIYRRSRGFSSIDIPLKKILIIDTGKTRRTGEMVNRVREFSEKNKDRFSEILSREEELINEVLDAFKSLDFEKIGELMLVNQSLLREVGVSSNEIEEAIKLALDAGAYGAKLTGAGGGGCVICLVDEDKFEKVSKSISNKFKVYLTELSAEGLREEKI